MKALTVCQPWAWAIIHGDKRVENRPRLTTYRGPLLIHAGKSRRYFDRLSVRETLMLEARGLPSFRDLDRGQLIGVVELVDCVEYIESEPIAADPFAYGPWCWILANPRPLPAPIPWRGYLSFFQARLSPDQLPPSLRRKRARR